MRRLRLLAWVICCGLWIQEGYEDVVHPRWLTPALGQLLDSLTIVATVALVAWTCTECVVRAMERKASALAAFIDATSARALPVDPRDSGPHPRPRLVEDRDTA